MPTILIVDDEPIDREMARRCLSEVKDLTVRAARDGASALEMIATEPPELVITDLRMPGMDGLELVERIRAEYPLTPVILLTSKGSETIAVKALESGASSYVPKSEAKDELAETVEKFLDVVETQRSQEKVLEFLESTEIRFSLKNDPGLISPVVGFVQDSLKRVGFADDLVRTRIGMAVNEALSNAIIHGNLEVSSNLRQKSRDAYTRKISQRRKEPPYSQRRVRFTAHGTPELARFVVADDGPGFDPASLPDPTSPDGVLAVSGRGIFLIRMFMDEVKFTDTGNHLTMIKRAGDTESVKSLPLNSND